MLAERAALPNEPVASKTLFGGFFSSFRTAVASGHPFQCGVAHRPTDSNARGRSSIRERGRVLPPFVARCATTIKEA